MPLKGQSYTLVINPLTPELKSLFATLPAEIFTDDFNFRTWPPRSPDLTVCDFFLWGFVKDNIHVPPFPKTLPELRERFNTAIGNVTQGMLVRAWREWEYRLDICIVTRGAHIECI
jgi:hypothetical protein